MADLVLVRSHSVRSAKIKLLISVVIIAIGYAVAIFVLPRLGLRIGFEAGLVLQGATVVVGYLIAGVICCIAAIQTVRDLRRSPSDRGFVGYAVLGATALITLVATYFLVLLMGSIHI